MLTQVMQYSEQPVETRTSWRPSKNDQDYDISMSKYVNFKIEEHHDVQGGDIMMTLCHE
jgi:hypothetical protein